MPAIDRKCFNCKQTTSHGLVFRVYASQWNWACTAFEHVETKTEEVVFSRRSWLSFIVGVRSELVRSYDRPPASPSGAIFIHACIIREYSTIRAAGRELFDSHKMSIRFTLIYCRPEHAALVGACPANSCQVVRVTGTLKKRFFAHSSPLDGLNTSQLRFMSMHSPA